MVAGVDAECYQQLDGSDYRGTVQHTVTGRQCQMWSRQHPHSHPHLAATYPDAGLGSHNYCRNPNGEAGGPWCYTTDPHERWEFCPVGAPTPMCPLELNGLWTHDLEPDLVTIVVVGDVLHATNDHRPTCDGPHSSSFGCSLL